MYLIRSVNDENSEQNPQNIIDDLLGPTSITLAEAEGNTDEALKQEVAKLVPAGAIFGGLALGTLCVISDIAGIIGGTQGMLIVSEVVFDIYRAWSDEKRDQR